MELPKANRASLYLVGMPLSEDAPIGPAAEEILRRADVLIAESKKVGFRFIKQATEPNEKQIFFLDPPRDDEREATFAALKQLQKTNGVAVLFSDGGMPVLFDPGSEVLGFCRANNFEIHTIPGPISWSVACAASGLEPPFHVAGFLSRETPDRIRELNQLKSIRAHLVFLETPYRFKLLLKQTIECFGGGQAAFLAWELGKSDESLLWGTLKTIESTAKERGWEKGEFILILVKGR